MSELDFSKLTVLVVDDQEYIRKLVVQCLKRLGVVGMAEAADGPTALEILGRASPSVVLCDIRMQPIGGLEVLRKVRAGEGIRNPDVPFIFLTTDSDRETVKHAIEAHVDGYMVKPASPQELKNKITAVLNRRQGG